MKFIAVLPLVIATLTVPARSTSPPDAAGAEVTSPATKSTQTEASVTSVLNGNICGYAVEAGKTLKDAEADFAKLPKTLRRNMCRTALSANRMLESHLTRSLTQVNKTQMLDSLQSIGRSLVALAERNEYIQKNHLSKMKQ